MKKSSFTLLVVVAIGLIIAGMLFISAVNAYWVKEMEVKMEIDNRETSNKEITISRVESEKARVNFRAIIDCQSHLDIIEIDKDRNVFLIFSSDSPGDSTNGDGCEIKKSFAITPEETIEHFNVIFLSPGIDNYGKNQTISELLKDWQSKESKTIEQIIGIIYSDTVGIAGSNDLMATREIIVRTEEPKIDIDWTIGNSKLEIYGRTNLPKDTIIEWRFVDPSIRTEGCAEVNWNRRIRFTINDINAKKIKGNLILEKDGKLITEETIIWSKYKKLITPTIKKINELPVSRSASPKISESTPTPTRPPPTTIPGRPETSETPGMELLPSIIAITITATAFLKKRKK